MTLYEARDLSVAFGERFVVRNLSFAIAPGECLALVGESGSGKSQACLAPFGLTPGQVSGSVRLDGTELVGVGEGELRTLRGRDAGFVFQQPLSALTPHLTIGRQLAESLKRRASPAELAALLGEVRLTDPARRLRQYPHELSGGMRQRVMIAMALAHRPKLLIADEPTTALDVLVQREILDLLDGLRRERGLALLLVSHDLGLVAGRAEQVVVMQDGREVESGPAARVLGQPREAMTRTLVSSIPRLDAPLPDRTPVGPVLLEGRNLSVDFPRRDGWFGRGTTRVVSDVSLLVREGEAVGIVGASGSGKSTLARGLARLGPVAAGGIYWRGQELPQRGRLHGTARRGFQMVFQDPVDSLDPRLSVADAVAEPLVTMRPDIPPSQRAARVSAVLREVELDESLWQRRPRALSGGQAQRACIARALVAEPELLVCDEATSALDVSVQAGIIELFGRLQRARRLALLFISHDLALVRRLCHRVIVMADGRVVEEGESVAVVANPQSEAARRLVEAVPNSLSTI